MKRPIVIKDKKWKWLDESHPVNDYVRELHKYIDYLEAKDEKLPISNVRECLIQVNETLERYGKVELSTKTVKENDFIGNVISCNCPECGSNDLKPRFYDCNKCGYTFEADNL